MTSCVLNIRGHFLFVAHNIEYGICSKELKIKSLAKVMVYELKISTFALLK